MKLSELIAAYGDDKVQWQKLDECSTMFQRLAGGKGTKITFRTDEPFGGLGTDRLGLIVWLDRKRVAELIAAFKATGASS